MREGRFYTNNEVIMNKPEIRRIEYIDFEEAICYIATKYNKNAFNLQDKLVEELELSAMLPFTLIELEDDLSKEFVKEFGASTTYIWEW